MDLYDEEFDLMSDNDENGEINNEEFEAYLTEMVDYGEFPLVDGLFKKLMEQFKKERHTYIANPVKIREFRNALMGLKKYVDVNIPDSKIYWKGVDMEFIWLSNSAMVNIEAKRLFVKDVEDFKKNVKAFSHIEFLPLTNGKIAVCLRFDKIFDEVTNG